ncbi:MAG: hypothetical protein GX666_09360 [Tissierellia bacterium]|nr:hypothetical protein [Tissierellia bacterium]
MKKLGIILVLVFVLINVSSCSSSQEANNFVLVSEVAEKNDAQDKVDNKEYLENYMWEETKETFSQYYELLGCKIENYKEEVKNDVCDAIFDYKIYYQNFDKDPDIVPYIKEAKENKDPNYNTYYKEYLKKQEMNISIRALKYPDEIILYTDISPKGESVWEEFQMDDLVISNNN